MPGAARSIFGRYWFSAFLADFGDGVRMAAFPLLAAQVTSSPAAVAAVLAVQGLPWIVVGLGAGALVDRLDLRSTMAGVDVVRAALISALVVAISVGALSLWLVYLTAFVTGVGSLLRDTAASTAVPRLVGADELDRANGRLVAGRLVGNELAGPAVGGWVFGIAAALPFALDAGGLGLAVILLLTLPSVFAPLPRAEGQAGGPVRSAVADLRAGLGWLRRDRPVRTVVLAVGIVAIADGAYLAVLALYVVQVLHRSPAAYGLLLAVGALGGVVASAGAARLTRRIGTRRVLVGAVVVMAATQLVLGITDDLVVAAAVLACSSAAFAAFNVVSVSLRQRRTPRALLGRVNSTYLTVGRSAEALGALTGGAIATLAGIRAPILLGVVPLLLAALLLRRSGDAPAAPALA